MCPHISTKQEWGLGPHRPQLTSIDRWAAGRSPSITCPLPSTVLGPSEPSPAGKSRRSRLGVSQPENLFCRWEVRSAAGSHYKNANRPFVTHIRPRNMTNAASARTMGWCFTLNNPSGLVDLHALPHLEYGVFQEEISSTGTHHLQGYLHFTQRKRMNQVIDMEGMEGSHVEPRRGTIEEAVNYCKDPAKRLAHTEPTEFGIMPTITQGKRNDILTLTQELRAGKGFKELSSHDHLVSVMARSMRYVERMEVEYSQPVDRHSVHTTLHFGPPGVGKTYCATQGADQDYYVYTPVPGMFWNQYRGQSKVVFDEFDGSSMPPLTFQRIFDKLRYTINTKGSSMYFRGVDLHITTNYLPTDWWKEGTKYKRDAVIRRLDECHLHTAIGQCQIFVSNENGYSYDQMLAAGQFGEQNIAHQ